MTLDDPLEIWTVYEGPADWPDGFVTRCFRVFPGGTSEPGEAFFCLTLDDARNCVPPGLHCMPRALEDDAVIVETWI
jgi:hypothetical protein